MYLSRMGGQIYITNTVAGGTVTIQGDAGANVNNMLSLGAVPGAVASTGGWGFDIPFTLKFTAANIINIGEIQALFDLYKIVSCKVYVTYNHNVSTASGTSGLPGIMWFRDPDNAAVEDPFAIRERMGVVRKSFTPEKRTRVMWIKYPRKMGAIFDEATGALNVAQPMGGWTDLDDINIPHYGIKGMLTNVQLPTTLGTSFFKFEVRFGLKLKYAR